MDSFEYNKLIGALLGVVFVIFSVSLISDAIFASPAPEKPGYAIEAAEGGGEAAGAKEEEGPVDIAPLMADADASKGEAIAKRCQACHSIEKGGPNKVGPDLWGVVGRPIATHEGFSYSQAMKDFSEGGEKHWDFQLLSNFIHNPKKDVPGTAMGFAGLPKPEDRANLLAYLNQQSDNPLPMPEVKAEPEGEAKAPEGEAKADEAAGGEEKPEAVGKDAPAAEEQNSQAPAGETEQPKTGDQGSGNASGQATGDKAPGNPTVTVPGKEEGQPDTKPSDDAEHQGAPANAPAAKPDAATEDQPKAGEGDEPEVEETPQSNGEENAPANDENGASGTDNGGNAQSEPQGESGSGAGSTPQTGSKQDTGSASGDGSTAPTTRQDEGPEKPVDDQ